jgi:abhydrolase domain-containing protein 17
MGASFVSLRRGMLFSPPERTYENDVGLVWLRTRKKLVFPAFYQFGTPSPDHHHGDKHYVLLFCHANAEDLGMAIYYVRELVAAVPGLDVFMFDYCGYGLAEGTPSEEGLYQCVEAAYTYTLNIGYLLDYLLGYFTSISRRAPPTKADRDKSSISD